MKRKIVTGPVLKRKLKNLIFLHGTRISGGRTCGSGPVCRFLKEPRFTKYPMQGTRNENGKV